MKGPLPGFPGTCLGSLLRFRGLACVSAKPSWPSSNAGAPSRIDEIVANTAASQIASRLCTCRRRFCPAERAGCLLAHLEKLVGKSKADSKLSSRKAYL